MKFVIFYFVLTPGENTGRPDMTMRPFTNPPSVTDDDDGNPAPVCPENIDAFTTTADGRTFAFTGIYVTLIITFRRIIYTFSCK